MNNTSSKEKKHKTKSIDFDIITHKNNLINLMTYIFYILNNNK